MLATVFLLATLYQLGFSVASIDNLRHSTTEARQPLLFGYRLDKISGLEAEARTAGLHFGDVLEQVQGRPFKGVLVLDEMIGKKHAGDTINVHVLSKSGLSL